MEKEGPLVSIIIPTYNYGRYLPEAIESALRQTYQRIEVIVVDDGSTDDTKTIVKRYPVRYVYQKNRGVALAMNNGIKLSRGEFFVCLAADDKLAPEYVRKTMNVINKDPKIGFVRTGSRVWNQDTGDENILMPRKIYTKYAILAVGWTGALGTVLTRRIAFDSLGDGFDATLPAHEDVDLCFRLCLKGWKTEAVFEPLHLYRIHESSRNPKTIEERCYAASFIDRKFWFRKLCRRLYWLYQQSLGRIVALMSHPIAYLKGLKKKTKVIVWAKSYVWNDSKNRMEAYKVLNEIMLVVDLLREWSKNKNLRNYYAKRLKILEFRLQEIFSKDARIRSCSTHH